MKFWVFHYALPCINRVRVFCLRLFPCIYQGAAHIGIFYPYRAVNIPRRRYASLTPPRLIRRDARLQQRVIHSLQFPCNDAVFYMDHPTATACAVVPVSASYYLVILPAIPVKFFPSPFTGVYFILYPCSHLYLPPFPP